MQLTALRPRQALNKAYLKLKTSRTQMEAFKHALRTLVQSLDLTESEEHVKNHLRDFLKTSFYQDHAVNTKGKTDLVIHNGPSTKTQAGVLLEVKRPGNKADMPTPQNLNYKALHELVLYYLRERVEHKNNDLKQLIITNVQEWFVFDAHEFDRLFFRNGQLKKDFTDWSQGKKSGSSTDYFYKEIAAPHIAKLTEEVRFTYFNLKDYEKPLKNADPSDDVKLVALYKLLSPAHLLKEQFANDANSLDQGFYQELLHIIGLEEVRDKGRKLIRRKASPDPGSLLEAAYQKLKSEDLVAGLENAYDYGNTREEQLFNVALELCITWMNRILFLKLLEAQLASYHHGDKAYAFMSPQHLYEFDDLNELFFDVLAERPQSRSTNVRERFRHIPYLNSSLFETTPLERRTLRISNLKDSSRLALFPRTVLRDGGGKALSKSKPDMRTLEYLLRFLGSYDFGAEGKEAIQEENKTLITASVLGLIFEKINGYKDGSFYTPGFITMYMCRETIRRAVVQRFNEQNGWELQDFESLRFRLMANYSPQTAKEGNELMNGLRICDPAVGSGHYLVSALNELIVIKAELRLLLNRQGQPLHYGTVEVQNDELIVTDHHGELFHYTVHVQPNGQRSINPQAQELQETLFHEKQTLIENCLFGVDINPNSVKICRLRLWIELLKNAYYIGPSSPAALSSPVCYAQEEGLREGFAPASAPFTELQTLPNIDINIKQGNSLLSRYPLTADLKEAFGKKGKDVKAYREAVRDYKHTNSKETKKQLVKSLEEIKQGFRTTLRNNDPLRKTMADLRGKIAVMQNPSLFGAAKVNKADLAKEQKKLEKLEAKREEIETNKMYVGAFEWRFEFPEVLDEEGSYQGFDVVIGNPPYIKLQDLKDSTNLVDYYRNKFSAAKQGNYDIYVLFIELGLNLAREDKGLISYILPHKFINANYGEPTRELLTENNSVTKLIHFGHTQIFGDATTYTCLLFFSRYSNTTFEYQKVEDITKWKSGETSLSVLNGSLLGSSDWVLLEGAELDLFNKLTLGKPTLEEKTERIYQGLKTSADDIFIVEEKERVDGKVRITCVYDSSDYWLEQDLLYPLIKGGNSKRYFITPTDKLILFPYDKASSKLVTEENLQEYYPLTWKYLSKHREYLENREGGKHKEKNWYGYGRNQAIDLITKAKIFTPDISVEPSFSFDQLGQYLFTGGAAGGYGIIPKDGVSYHYLLGLLNSKVTKWLISKISTEMRGGWWSFESRFIKKLPIESADYEIEGKITGLVEEILTLRKVNPSEDTSTLEEEINLLVYELYNLQGDERTLFEKNY